jgi:hypothetical protein
MITVFVFNVVPSNYNYKFYKELVLCYNLMYKLYLLRLKDFSKWTKEDKIKAASLAGNFIVFFFLGEALGRGMKELSLIKPIQLTSPKYEHHTP